VATWMMDPDEETNYNEMDFFKKYCPAKIEAIIGNQFVFFFLGEEFTVHTHTLTP